MNVIVRVITDKNDLAHKPGESFILGSRILKRKLQKEYNMQKKILLPETNKHVDSLIVIWFLICNKLAQSQFL